MADYVQHMQMKQMQARMCEPLYDAIEEGDFEKGIKLANSKNLRSVPLALALKGYCHACTKEMGEALKAARECMAMYPTEESALGAVQHTLRICNKEEELGPFYETLYTRYPGSPGILAMMFNFYVRIGDGKKMQNTAQKLYKVTNDPKFQFWSVGSMLQQNELPPMMLTIAEKTIAKLFFPPAGDAGAIAKDAKLVQPGAEEIELYLEILLRQNKVDEALMALDNLYGRPTGLGKGIKDDATFKENASIVKMHEMRYRSLRVEICTKLVTSGTVDTARTQELVAAVRSEHETLLLSYPDQWSSHQQLVYIAATGCLLEQGGAFGEGLTLLGDGSGASLLAHLSSLRKMKAAHASLRGPYLAEILLLMLWINLGAGGTGGALPGEWDPTPLPGDYPSASTEGQGEAVGSLVGLICAYIDRFQSKQCCFGDIKDKIDFLVAKTGAEAASAAGAGGGWLEGLSAWAGSRAREIEEDVRRHIAESSGGNEKEKEKEKGKEHPGREECISMVCSLAVMGQVSCYANHHLSATLTSQEQAQADRADMARLQLHLQTKAFCAGGVGGDREVQPADEVLLLASPWRKQGHAAAARAEAASGAEGRGTGASLSAAWATVLAAGVAASPFSHAFKLDSLDPLRNLAAGQHALSLFEALGVRHVQHDSMSYLVLPLLMEAGLFKEAHRQHVQVCNFHVKAGKDTGEMIGKAFEHSNYAKGLEMRRFHQLCQASLQLALSKAELPLIELLENGKYSEVEPAAQYLEGCVEEGAGAEGSAPLYMAFIDDEKMASLSDNCDYGVMVRCDSTVEEEREGAAARRGQAEQRIREAQLTLHLLSASLNADTSKAVQKLAQWRAHLEGRGTPVVPVPASAEALMTAINEKAAALAQAQAQTRGRGGREGMSASQELRSGSLAATLCLHTAIHGCFSFSAACASTLEVVLALDPASTEQGDILTKGQVKMEEARQQASELVVAMKALQECLTADASLYDLVGTKKGAAKSVSPAGINALSAFTRTLGRWLPLVLKAGLQSFPEPGSDADDTSAAGAGAGDDAVVGREDVAGGDVKATYRRILGQVGRDIRMVSDKARELIQAVRTALGSMESDAGSFHRLRPNPLFELESLVAAAKHKAQAGAGAGEAQDSAAFEDALDMVEKCRSSLAKEVPDSHAISCARLLSYLDTAVQMLG